MGNTEETVKMAKKTPGELFSEINELNIEELEILAAALRKKLDVSIRNHGRDDTYGEIPSPGFEIYLIECDTHNVQAIKLIRGFTYCSLSEAKECLNHLPIKITRCGYDDEADSIKKRFEDIGAAVRIERVWS